jgi:hypothetical protein
VRLLVICAAVVSLVAPVAHTQAPRAPQKSKGPRALGLLQIGPDKKARLIPIEILYDGEYYDAGAYKASPVPFALWSGTVYEGFLSGVSQGLFTITGVLENPETKEWRAEGNWVTADMLAKKSVKKKTVSDEPRGLNDDSGPPVLRRAATAEEPKAPEKPPAPETPPTPQTPASSLPASPTQPTSSAPSTGPAAASAPAPQPATTTANSSPASNSPSPPEDANHPTLKRGKPAEESSEPLVPIPNGSTSPQSSSRQPSAAQPRLAPTAAKAADVQLIPAISDANGPEAQPYKYEMKPEDETALRTKVLAMASNEVWAYIKETAAASTQAAKPGQKPKSSAAGHPPEAAFSDVQFWAFDLYNSNEPVFIVTASARVPQSPKEKAEPALQTPFLVTLIARQDINGDFHKVFSSVTDAQDLDIQPRMEFIDAVDADGDGHGELLFRQVSDAGSSFVVYRVIGNQVWTLFQGTPGS